LLPQDIGEANLDKVSQIEVGLQGGWRAKPMLLSEFR
jgi:hypothetical protein